MRTILIFCLVLANSLALSAQRIDSTITKKKIGLISVENSKTTENGTTSYSVTLSFRDGRYQAIEEYGVIILSDQNSVDTLIADLTDAKKYIGGKVSWTLKRTFYQVAVTNGKWITIEDTHGAFTNINVSQADKIIEWLRSVKMS
jgi:hypothetical protein